MRLGHGTAGTRIITVRYTSDPDRLAPAMLAVREPQLVPASQHRALGATLQVLEEELTDAQAGADAALDSILDLLLVQIMRAAVRDLCQDPQGAPVDGRLDPVTRDAHALLHQHPEKDWTTDSLAAAVRVSRATLHRHFMSSLGTAPLTYLTRWRMNIAAGRLRDSDDPVGQIARSVGYASAHAFGRAFHREQGQTPGEYRGAYRSRRPSSV